MTAAHHSQTAAVTGVVLAGGLSSRMGRDKAAIVLSDGRTMMQHVRDALGQVCNRVITVGPHDRPTPAQQFDLHDLRPACGPLGGIEAALASGIDPHGEYLFCACDAPLMTASVLRLLTDARSSIATVFHVADRPRFECLPQRLSTRALPVVRDRLDRGELAVWRMIESLHPQLVPIDESRAECLRNVNTPEELRALNERLSAAIHPIAR